MVSALFQKLHLLIYGPLNLENVETKGEKFKTFMYFENEKGLT